MLKGVVFKKVNLQRIKYQIEFWGIDLQKKIAKFRKGKFDKQNDLVILHKKICYGWEYEQY